jgi:hypothetical protein
MLTTSDTAQTEPAKKEEKRNQNEERVVGLHDRYA